MNMKLENQLIKLIDKKNILLNELEAIDNGIITKTNRHICKIQNKLEKIYKKIDKIESK